jgi:hypothetical protein
MRRNEKNLETGISIGRYGSTGNPDDIGDVVYDSAAIRNATSKGRCRY